MYLHGVFFAVTFKNLLTPTNIAMHASCVSTYKTTKRFTVNMLSLDKFT